MTSPIEPVEVWVYTEDSSKGTPLVFQRLIPRLFRLVEPATQTQHLRVKLPAGDAAHAMRAHRWPPKDGTGLLRLVPHYSLEAWLYLHQDKMRKLLDEGGHLGASTWRLEPHDDRGFDAIQMPKDRCPLGDKHNADLADGWPAAFAVARSPSLKHTIAAWRQDDRLREKLRSTSGWRD